MGPDGRLPSERQLAADLDAGRTTIRLVLMKLATEGKIRSEHGQGYFIIGADDSQSMVAQAGSARPAPSVTATSLAGSHGSGVLAGSFAGLVCSRSIRFV